MFKASSKAIAKGSGKHLIYSHKGSCGSCSEFIVVHFCSEYLSYEVSAEEALEIKAQAENMHHSSEKPMCAKCGEPGDEKVYHLLRISEVNWPKPHNYPKPKEGMVLVHPYCIGLVSEE